MPNERDQRKQKRNMKTDTTTHVPTIKEQLTTKGNRHSNSCTNN